MSDYIEGTVVISGECAGTYTQVFRSIVLDINKRTFIGIGQIDVDSIKLKEINMKSFAT